MRWITRLTRNSSRRPATANFRPRRTSTGRLDCVAAGRSSGPELFGFGPSAVFSLAVSLVYGQTARHEFLAYDDEGFIQNNPHVTPGLTGGTSLGADQRPLRRLVSADELSHMLDCQLYGLKPAGHHLTKC